MANGIAALVIAGAFGSVYDRALKGSQIYQYTKSAFRALTGEMIIYVSGALIFAGLAAWLIFGARRTMLKRIACRECGAKSAVPAEPSLATSREQ